MARPGTDLMGGANAPTEPFSLSFPESKVTLLAVNKFAKGVILAAAGAGAIASLSLLSINLYVESSKFQSQLETMLSRELKMPVKVGQIHLSPLGHLKARDLSIPVEQKGGGTEFLHIPDVSAKVAWGPLFAGRLIVEELSIHSPKVEWAQTKKGRWKLPQEKAPKKNGKSEEVAKVEPTPKPQPEVEAERPSKPEKTPKRTLEFRISVARLDHGTFRFLDRKGREVALFEGVSVSCPEISKGSVTGVADIEKVTFHGKWVIHHFRTPFSYENGNLSFPEIKASIGGGTLSGVYTMQPEEEGTPFRVQLDFEKVDLGNVLREADVDSTVKAEGILNGKLSLEGKGDDEDSIRGDGRFTLDQGIMEQNSFIQMLGQALQIEELARLELQQSHMNCRVADGRVYIEELLLASKNLQLTASGETRFDGKLQLQADLGVNQRLSRQFPKWIADKFTPTDLGSVLRFNISGTLDRPETDLMRLLIGERLERQAVNLIEAFRSLSKPPKKEKKKRE